MTQLLSKRRISKTNSRFEAPVVSTELFKRAINTNLKEAVYVGHTAFEGAYNIVVPGDVPDVFTHAEILEILAGARFIKEANLPKKQNSFYNDINEFVKFNPDPAQWAYNLLLVGKRGSTMIEQYLSESTNITADKIRNLSLDSVLAMNFSLFKPFVQPVTPEFFNNTLSKNGRKAYPGRIEVVRPYNIGPVAEKLLEVKEVMGLTYVRELHVIKEHSDADNMLDCYLDMIIQKLTNQ